MLEIITILSVIYNFGLLFFTSHYLVNISWEYRWIMFIVAEHFMFAIKYTLSFSIEDSPADVLIQLERYVRTLIIFTKKIIYISSLYQLLLSSLFDCTFFCFFTNLSTSTLHKLLSLLL